MYRRILGRALAWQSSAHKQNDIDSRG